MSGLKFSVSEVVEAAKQLATLGTNLTEISSELINYQGAPEWVSIIAAVKRAGGVNQQLAEYNQQLGTHLHQTAQAYYRQEAANTRQLETVSTSISTVPISKFTTSLSPLSEFKENLENGLAEFTLPKILHTDLHALAEINRKLANQVEVLDDFQQHTMQARSWATNNWHSVAASNFENKVDQHLHKVSAHVQEMEDFNQKINTAYYALTTHQNNIKHLVTEIKDISPGQVQLSESTGEADYQSTGNIAEDTRIKAQLTTLTDNLQQEINAFKANAQQLTYQAHQVFHPVKESDLKQDPSPRKLTNRATKSRKIVSVKEHDKINRRRLDAEIRRLEKNPQAIEQLTINGIPMSEQTHPLEWNAIKLLRQTCPGLFSEQGQLFGNYLEIIGVYMPTNHERAQRLRGLKAAIAHSGHYLISFTPDSFNGGKAIVSIGNPDIAKQVGIFVPGAGVNVGHIGGELGQMWQLMKNSRGGAVGKSGIVYVNYDNPPGIFEAGRMDAANSGAAKALHDFINQRASVNPQAAWNAVGHSYGGELLAQAAQVGTPLRINNALFLGNPGLPINNIEEFETHLVPNNFPGRGHAIVANIPFDAATLLGSWHGTPQFGNINIPFLHLPTGIIAHNGNFGMDPRHRVPGLPDAYDLVSYPQVLEEIKSGYVVTDPLARHTSYFDNKDYAKKIGNKLFE